MKKLFFFPLFISLSIVSLSQDKRIPVPILDRKHYKFTGELGHGIGDTATVRGIIMHLNFKGADTGPNLLVQMIRDSSNQEVIQIPVSASLGNFGDTLDFENPSNFLPRLIDGASYRFLVYETGRWVGTPIDAYVETTVTRQPMFGGFHFHNRLIVITAEKIDPIEWSPIHFPGRNALLSGIAKNDNGIAVIQSLNWKLRLIGSPQWTRPEIGKLAEAYGIINETKTKGIYETDNARVSLARLEDQLGKTVKLRGTALSHNDHWWFNYRGTDMYVENMDKLPGWTHRNQGLQMEITGILEETELPDKYSLKRGELKKYYIVRNASWAPIDELLAPEIDLELD
jgi:hypothetical protein